MFTDRFQLVKKKKKALWPHFALFKASPYNPKSSNLYNYEVGKTVMIEMAAEN